MSCRLTVVLLLICLLSKSLSWKITGPGRSVNKIDISKHNIFVSCLIGSLALTLDSLPCRADYQVAPWNDKIQYEIVKSNPNGDLPKVGEMTVVRFKGSYKGTTFDDTFSTDQPYYYRAGVGLCNLLNSF